MMRSAKPVAVYTHVDGFDLAPGRRLLEEAGFEVRLLENSAESVVMDAAADASALLVGYDPVGPTPLMRLPELRIIATHSAGYDMVDTETAQERGIWVCNVPDAATEEVAVHALALILAQLRGLPDTQQEVRRGAWPTELERELHRPSTLTLGLVGLGRIASRLACLARPLFGRIVAYDPEVPIRDGPEGVSRAGLSELLSRADVVSLHCPLTTQTHHLMEESRLRTMRPGAILVNVSRGGLVDSHALSRMLDEGILAAAAVDVFESEPPATDEPLHRHPKVLATPHLAFLSAEAARSYVTRAADNVATWLKTGQPATPVVKGRT